MDRRESLNSQSAADHEDRHFVVFIEIVGVDVQFPPGNLVWLPDGVQPPIFESNHLRQLGECLGTRFTTHDYTGFEIRMTNPDRSLLWVIQNYQLIGFGRIIAGVASRITIDPDRIEIEEDDGE